MKRSAGYLSIVGAAALWGCIGVFVKTLSSQGFSSLQIVAVRLLWAMAAVGAVMILRDRGLFVVRLRDCGWFVGSGVIGLVFFNWCYFTAIDLSSMAVAAVLLYTAPIFVMILSVFLFREQLTLVKLAALALTFGGCVLVTGLLQGSGEISPLGVLIGVGSGLGYALYSIFSSYALRRYHFLTVTFYTLLLGAVGVLPLANPTALLPAMFAPQTLLYGIGLGVLCCMMPNLLYTRGLAVVEASRASIIATLEPVVATLLGVTVFGEGMTWMKFCGMVLIIGAVALLNRRRTA